MSARVGRRRRKRPTMRERELLAPTAMRPFYKQSDLLAVLGVTRVTLWHWRRAGLFPEPMRIGFNKLAWTQDQVEAWLAARERARPEPVVARGRR